MVRVDLSVQAHDARFPSSELVGQILMSTQALVLLVVCSALVLTGCTRRHDKVASQTPSPSQRSATPADFDGDRISDWFIYRGGNWLRFGPPKSAGDPLLIKTGAPGSNCIPAPADYDGDGRVDLSQKCGGSWYFYNANGTDRKAIWTGGLPGDLPVPADYDGDGGADVVVFRTGAWMFYDYASGVSTRSVMTGPAAGGIAVPMDYDGDGSADFSVYQKGAWTFFNDDGTLYKKSDGTRHEGIWTGVVVGDVPVPGDYHGLGREEVVIFRGGAWMFYDLNTRAYTGGVWTGATRSPGRPLQPAPLDLDGDGTLEFTVYNGEVWSFYQDDGSLLTGVRISGAPNDKAISRRQQQ